jgi:hypothetical protein
MHKSAVRLVAMAPHPKPGTARDHKLPRVAAQIGIEHDLIMSCRLTG